MSRSTGRTVSFFALLVFCARLESGAQERSPLDTIESGVSDGATDFEDLGHTGEGVVLDETEFAGDDWGDLSLEQLMEIEVVSVAKKEQKLQDTAAAIYVITNEEMRRSGLRSIPESLRMVPGMQVARIDGNKWAISSRGFNGRFANKLLVLQDGRSVYTPLFSGVFWDVQDALLEDLDRIEVIRGPGGTLWGANAVNGVINILTKSARETQGFYAHGGGGSEEHGFGAIRYGGTLSENAHYRVFMKYANHDGLERTSGGNNQDDWEALRGGLRADWEATADDLITVLGDVYYAEVRNPHLAPTFANPSPTVPVVDNTYLFGGNLLARWKHVVSDDSDFALQAYFDHTDRRDFILEEQRDTLDVEFQHRLALPGIRQEILWGLNYRLTIDEIRDSAFISFDPGSRHVDLASAFVQDEITVIEDLLRLTIGSKFEHNEYTEFEIQPSIRAVVTPDKRHTFWGAVSRAIRTPSRVEDDARINFAVIPASPPLVPLPTRVVLQGTGGFTSEDLTAFELGYRTQLFSQMTFDLTAFVNLYDNLLTFEPGGVTPMAGPPPHLAAIFLFDNKMDGEAYGVEIAANYQATSFWRLSGGFTFFTLDLHLDNSSGGTTVAGEQIEGDNPRHQAHLRSHVNLPWDTEFDAALYYVDSLPRFSIPSYVRLDLRLGWRPTENTALSVVFQNLLDPEHPEFGAQLFETRSEVERAVYAMLSVRF